MTTAPKRIFKKDQWVYVVDYWGTSEGTQAFAESALILKVNEKKQTFLAVLYGDTYKTYSFNDYGRLIFDTQYEAIVAANKLPKPKTTVYQIIGKKVYKKLVLDIYGHHVDGTYDLVLCLNRGKSLPTKEIGHTLFLNDSDARAHMK